MSSAQAFSHQLGFSPVLNITPVVYVVCDGFSAHASLKLLLRSQGWRPEILESAKELFDHPTPVVPNCLILDVSRLGEKALELQRRVSHERSEMPVIFISGSENIPMTVQAMKAGAVDFLMKPLNNDVLLAAVRESLHRSRFLLDRATEMRELRDCYSSLTRRERQVMGLVVSGLLNKQVGGELGISEITVKAHRAQVMQKMRANSLADLVRMSAKVGSVQQGIHLA